MSSALRSVLGRPAPGPALAGLTLAGLALAGLALAGPALAQSFTGNSPAQRFVLPGSPEAAGARPAAPEAQAAGRADPRRGRPAPPPPAAAPPPIPQRPLPGGIAGLRLAGEEASLEWPVYFSEAQARESVRLRVAYLSAISVAPETSSLTASLNDAVIGRTDIKAPGAVKIVEFEVPEGALRPGWNALRLSAVQRHRVDCSLGATYELWTQIDPSWTGFVLPPKAPGIALLRDLPALRPDGSGAVPVRIVIGGRPSPARLEGQIRAAQALAVGARLTQAVVEFGPPLAGEAGVNLVVGTPDEIRTLPGLPAGAAPSGGRAALVPGEDGRAPTVVVSGAGEAEIDRALAGLAAQAAEEPAGSAVGRDLLARRGGYAVAGGEEVRLDALGLPNREFTGRLFRTGFDLALPADFVPADYAKVMLRLAGGYAPGLAPGAQLIVDLNGRNAASATLPKSGGDLFEATDIPLPLSLWRPGRNRVEIAAQVPSAADATCDTLAAEGQKRFLFLNTTRVSVPPLARAVRVPDLAADAGGAMHYLRGARPRLVVPNADRETMSAAATLAVRLALAAGRTIDFALVTDPPGASPGPSLVVSPVRSLDPGLLRSIGVDPDQMREIWQSRAELPADAARAPLAATGPAMSLDRLRNDVPAACSLPAAPARTASIGSDRARERRGPAPQARDLVASWDDTVRGRASVVEGLTGVAAAAWGGLRDTASDTLSWVSAQVAAPPVAVSPRATLLVGQAATGDSLDDLVTVVTAPNATILRASVSCLTDPGIWSRLRGRLATLDASDGSLATVEAAHPRLAETQVRSLDNLRLVVAGWLSMNPFIYVALSLAVALGLGVSTRTMVSGIGRENRPNRAGGRNP
ncbi:hypothetical protein OPKNFCMD_2891 [Methylobacterium crusticola]|uniref:Cyclic di-GMP-binding protein n=2 Tax=Methylobacterium crusticola TaxID=1697972 RepID=A0ABQ4QYZ2_9HYPH|nr:cellulose biosynthesis cyclic di-GMP-binding regulatory protein BcsB [Methylobacterium crusticola]GJD50154.1 hypothetical protein OPKNFCMD_2891 [Methylobacterium crusticola]